MATPVPPPIVGDEAPGAADAAAAIFRDGTPKALAIPGPRALNPYEDDEALGEFYSEFERQCLDGRLAYEQEWWRKLLYRAGRQWITLGANGQWRDKNLARWVPKPVTNKVHETYDAINSVFATVDPSIIARPLGNNPRDVLTSETSGQLEEPIKADHGYRKMAARQNFWHIMTGNVFLHPWWDADSSTATIVLPFFQCQNPLCGRVSPPEDLGTGACPNCKGLAFQPAMGQDGKPLQNTYGFGKGKTDVCSPFEIFVPDTYTDFDDAPGVIHKRWRAKFYYERVFGKDALRTHELAWERSPENRSMQLLRSMALMPDLHDGRVGMQGVGTEGQAEGLTESTFWHKPCDQYPEGLWMRVGGGRGAKKPMRLDAKTSPQKLPYRTSRDQPIWPWVHLVYERVDGRLWGETPISLTLQKNDQINQIDSLMQMMATRTANPAWLHPKGADVKHLTGEPGLIIKYTPVMLGSGAPTKPERVEGANIPASLPILRQQLITDIETLVGTFDIIKGAKPSGVEAFSALQLLVERSQSRFGPVLMERGDAHARWYQIALELERAYGPPERTYAVLGPNATWSFQTFKQADLSGNVVFTVEDGSQVPKTNLGKRASIDQLRQLGAIDVMNPQTQYRILEVFGQTDLHPELDVHVRTALQEQDQWEKWAASVQFAAPQMMSPMGIPMPAMAPDPMTGALVPAPPQPTQEMPGIRQVWTSDPIHAMQHIRWANSDGVRRVITERPELVPYLTMFIQQHLDAMAMAAAAQAAPQGPGEGDQGGGNPMQRSNQESGKDNASMPAA